MMAIEHVEHIISAINHSVASSWFFFSTQDKRHFSPQKWSTWMHAIFSAHVVLYLLAVSRINFGRNVMKTALFFPGLRIGTAFLTLILKKVENKETGTSAAQTHVFETSLKVFSTTALF